MDARTALLALSLLAASCLREGSGTTVVAPTTQVTVVQQTVVQQTVPVHVQYGSRLDCDMLCGNIEQACEQACAPTSWSPNMQTVQDSCEHRCDFRAFACVGDCVRSGGFSRSRGR